MVQRQSDHLIGLCNCGGDWLFDENIDTGRKEGGCNVAVSGGRDTDRGCIDGDVSALAGCEQRIHGVEGCWWWKEMLCWPKRRGGLA